MKLKCLFVNFIKKIIIINHAQWMIPIFFIIILILKQMREYKYSIVSAWAWAMLILMQMYIWMKSLSNSLFNILFMVFEIFNIIVGFKERKWFAEKKDYSLHIYVYNNNKLVYLYASYRHNDYWLHQNMKIEMDRELVTVSERNNRK